MSFLARYWRPLAFFALLASAYLGGRWHQYQSDEKSHTAALLRQTQEARAKEQALNEANGIITDELLKDRAAAAADAASSADRLRKLSSSRSKQAEACSRLDEAAAAIIRPELRESLEREAQRADQAVIQLTKLQDYVSKVCQ